MCLCPSGIGFSTNLALPLILPLLLTVRVHRWFSKKRRELNTLSGPSFNNTFAVSLLQRCISTANSRHTYTHSLREICAQSRKLVLSYMYFSLLFCLSYYIFIFPFQSSLCNLFFLLVMFPFHCGFSTN